MATQTQTVREVAYLIEHEPRNTVRFFIREVFLANETITLTPFANVREVALLNDSTVQKELVTLRDVAQLNDLPSISVSYRQTAREVATLSDTDYPSIRYIQQVTELALVADAYSYVVDYLLRDTALLNETLSAKTTAARSVREVAKLHDRTAPTVGLHINELATLNDAYELRVRTRVNVRETALLSDIDTATIRQANVLRERALLNDTISASLQSVGILREVAYLSDKEVPPAYGRAYTCSVITWGMSTYTNFPFLTMTNKFAAGNNLWSLGAADDFGTPISWHLTTGIIDFGAAEVKHISSVYVAGTSEAPISVTVTGDVNGVKASNTYSLELRDQDNNRNNRAFIGKGFRSRFYQIKFGASDVKARLLTADAEVSAATRRL
jgi:hypothetical protein